ncbi:hypothetical protein AALB_0798 [Agarivorans albus MKT 106]|uniref:Uncharacterized protein n=1 Tax=Agarivorans albus MKT 106 TaxID=1331007 RepID=R9PHH7_AGAAL|nr:hypothetical protein AALB_0798 [Agarivorans albus MKT 106]
MKNYSTATATATATAWSMENEYFPYPRIINRWYRSYV